MKSRKPQPPNEEIVAQLMRLPDYELSAVLQEVFESRCPYPEERAHSRTHFFLGIASSSLNYENKWDGQVWGEWEISAVAYPNREVYPLGCRQGFWEFGTCRTCGTELRSNAKTATCPVCGEEKIGLT